MKNSKTLIGSSACRRWMNAATSIPLYYDAHYKVTYNVLKQVDNKTEYTGEYMPTGKWLLANPVLNYWCFLSDLATENFT